MFTGATWAPSMRRKLMRSPFVSTTASFIFQSRFVASARRSLRLGARGLDHFAPFLNLLREELAEVSGGAWKHRAAQVGEVRPHLRIGKGGVNFLIEHVNDFSGSIFGNAKPIGGARVVARQDSSDRRHVRQHLRTRRGCHSQGAQ